MENGELVFEILKKIQGSISNLESGQSRIERRLGTIEDHMATVFRSLTHHENDLSDLRQRIDPIERRLELHDPQH